MNSLQKKKESEFHGFKTNGYQYRSKYTVQFIKLLNRNTYQVDEIHDTYLTSSNINNMRRKICTRSTSYQFTCQPTKEYHVSEIEGDKIIRKMFTLNYSMPSFYQSWRGYKKYTWLPYYRSNNSIQLMHHKFTTAVFPHAQMVRSICMRSVLTPKEKQGGTATNSYCSRTDNLVYQNMLQ